jgi:hypothetical protein
VSAQGKSQPDQQCRNAQTELRDACQKSVDLFNYMTPQLGTAMVGGNPTLGQASTLGGLGHFSFGIRASAVEGSIPKFDDAPDPSLNDAVSTEYEMEDTPIPMPAVDLAIGLFKGIPLGITNLGGLDLLLSAAYVPEIDKDDQEIRLLTPDGSLKIGFGARLGILQEGAIMPGLSVSYLQRGLPTLNISTVTSDDTVEVRDLKFDASSWRIIASKKLLFIGLAAGYGMDNYKASGDITATVTGPCPGNPLLTCTITPGNDANGRRNSLVDFDQDVTRSNLFANLSLNLVILKLVAEVGQVSGGDIKTYNTYKDAAPDKTRRYASAGIRFGF